MVSHPLRRTLDTASNQRIQLLSRFLANLSIETAFQTAVALAEHENKRDKEGTILVTDRHLRSVLALSKDFKSYLTDLHDGRDESKRAEGRKERLDDSRDVPDSRKGA